jgi:hypothetical protein
MPQGFERSVAFDVPASVPEPSACCWIAALTVAVELWNVTPGSVAVSIAYTVNWYVCDTPCGHGPT